MNLLKADVVYTIKINGIDTFQIDQLFRHKLNYNHYFWMCKLSCFFQHSNKKIPAAKPMHMITLTSDWNE